LVAALNDVAVGGVSVEDCDATRDRIGVKARRNEDVFTFAPAFRSVDVGLKRAEDLFSKTWKVCNDSLPNESL
jgi:hypothetical protein